MASSSGFVDGGSSTLGGVGSQSSQGGAIRPVQATVVATSNSAGIQTFIASPGWAAENHGHALDIGLSKGRASRDKRAISFVFGPGPFAR
jgi:hypothetical protein